MAKDSGPNTAVLVALAAIGLLTATYSSGRAPAVAGPSSHDTTPGSAKRAVSGSDAGQDATHPLQIPPRGWWTVAKRVFAGFNDDRLMTEAAGVTFYTLLAIFPAVATLVSLYGLFADPATVNDQLQSIQGVVPSGGLDIISAQVKSLTANGRQALGFGVLVGLLTSLWSSNQGIKGLFDALNVVYHEKEKRGFVWRTVMTLGFTFGAMVFILLAMGAIVVVPIILTFFGFGDWATTLIAAARWPVLMVLLGLFLAVVYRFGPSRTQARWQWVKLWQRLRRDHLAGRLDRLLVLRRQFRQLQQDIWVARRRNRFYDVDLDFHDDRAARRRAERRAGAADQSRYHGRAREADR